MAVTCPVHAADGTCILVRTTFLFARMKGPDALLCQLLHVALEPGHELNLPTILPGRMCVEMGISSKLPLDPIYILWFVGLKACFAIFMSRPQSPIFLTDRFRGLATFQAA